MSVPTLLIERLRLGELPPEQADAVRARLRESGQLHLLEADDAAILAAYPPRVQAAAIRERVGTRGPRRLWIPVAVAAVALLALAPALRPSAPTAPWTAAKGSAQLLVYLESQDGPVLLHDEDAAAAGDRVQLVVLVPDTGLHGVVVSVDGAHAVTRHFAGPLKGGQAEPLAHSFELDDAPAYERFFLVTGPEPIDPDVVLQAAAGVSADGPLALPAHLDQTHIDLRKGTP